MQKQNKTKNQSPKRERSKIPLLDQRKKAGMAGERGARRARQTANTGRGQSTRDLTAMERSLVSILLVMGSD